MRLLRSETNVAARYEAFLERRMNNGRYQAEDEHDHKAGGVSS